MPDTPQAKPVEFDGFKIGDIVKIKNYTGMGDPNQLYKVISIGCSIATIQTTDDDKRAVLSFMNTMHYGIDRLEKVKQ